MLAACSSAVLIGMKRIVGRVGLIPFDVCLHVGRRHHPNSVSKRADCLRPVMRTAAGFQPNKAWGKLAKEIHHLRSAQGATRDNAPIPVNGMDLKH